MSDLWAYGSLGSQSLWLGHGSLALQLVLGHWDLSLHLVLRLKGLTMVQVLWDLPVHLVLRLGRRHLPLPLVLSSKGPCLMGPSHHLSLPR